eukprot:GHVP01022554.1.p1 GENE.GHVP01022554.1~~GHVP01022554.1.p1  ORF type:complete len:789 (+),score=100.82 GHVP01022554.1:2294-4660(+)
MAKEYANSTTLFSRDRREQLALGPTGENLHRNRAHSRSRAHITVVARKRPLSNTERIRNEIDIAPNVDKNKLESIQVQEPRKTVSGDPFTETHEFQFDRSFFENDSNWILYETCVKPLVDATFAEGSRSSCFAFGQTGSGKTYTMLGPKKKIDGCVRESDGLFEHAGRDMFAWLESAEFRDLFSLHCSFFEIYVNKVYDLLNSRRLVRALESKTKDGVVVKDLVVQKVKNFEEWMDIILSGMEQRITAQNSKNKDSSRGHGIFTCEIRNNETGLPLGKLAFIDLAGSERGADTVTAGRQTQQDGAGINRSLLALKECIRMLDQQSSHVPFRDSELTKVLRDMFIATKARTLMIANVSPASGCCEQTLNTLRYAERVRLLRTNSVSDVGNNKSDVDSGYAMDEDATFQSESEGSGSASHLNENRPINDNITKHPKGKQKNFNVPPVIKTTDVLGSTSDYKRKEFSRQKTVAPTRSFAQDFASSTKARTSLSGAPLSRIQRTSVAPTQKTPIPRKTASAQPAPRELLKPVVSDPILANSHRKGRSSSNSMVTVNQTLSGVKELDDVEAQQKISRSKFRDRSHTTLSNTGKRATNVEIPTLSLQLSGLSQMSPKDLSDILDPSDLDTNYNFDIQRTPRSTAAVRKVLSEKISESSLLDQDVLELEDSPVSHALELRSDEARLQLNNAALLEMIGKYYLDLKEFHRCLEEDKVLYLPEIPQSSEDQEEAVDFPYLRELRMNVERNLQFFIRLGRKLNDVEKLIAGHNVVNKTISNRESNTPPRDRLDNAFDI